MLNLRDYQKECVDVLNSLNSGRYLVSMATGLGKTVIFSQIKRRGRVLILSHREELVRQPLKYYNCSCGIEQGENYSNGEEVVSASVQSLIRRLNSFKPNDFDIIITDEAHHAAAPSYKKIYSYFKPRLHIGFTATPNRGDKVRLDDVFDKIIYVRDLIWGIQNGWLSDIKCIRVKVSYDLRKVKRRMGDFVGSELDRAVNNANFNKEIGEIYTKYARGQTLIFASSVAHANNIAKEIQGAVVVSQNTPNRKQIIDDFTNRKIPCLVNCMIFTEGTDMPLIETIIIARPTENASLYTQMVGRGLRLHKNKEYLTLVDCVGVTEKNEICQAPSLMGLDMKDIPAYKRDSISGMLLEMPEIFESATNCAINWVLNAQLVNLFAKEQGVVTYNINWIKKPNGDLVYQFACGDRIGIKAIDELGKTYVMRYVYNEKTDRFEYSKSNETSLSDALTLAYTIFIRDYDDERAFWDLSQRVNWEYEDATEKQIALIKGKISSLDFEELTKYKRLTKSDATQIINMLNIQNLKNSDLVKMHKKAVLEREKAEEKRKFYAKLKIRYILDKTKRFCKYYAIKHTTDLIICNDWERAKELIANLDGVDGEKCYYKGFLTISEAEDYLRK